MHWKTENNIASKVNLNHMRDWKCPTENYCRVTAAKNVLQAVGSLSGLSISHSFFVLALLVYTASQHGKIWAIQWCSGWWWHISARRSQHNFLSWGLWWWVYIFSWHLCEFSEYMHVRFIGITRCERVNGCLNSSIIYLWPVQNVHCLLFSDCKRLAPVPHNPKKRSR